jgi:hypothetical protein
MRRLSVVLLAALAVAGCKKKEPAPEQQQAAAAAPGALPAEVTGKVQERLDAPPYSYLRLQTKDGEVWAAVQKTDVEIGKDVTVIPSVFEESRTSSTLNRTFNKLYLGSLKGAEMAGAPAGMGPMGGAAAPEGMGGAQHGLARTEYKGTVKVAKASGADARTIGEVFGQRAQLKDKPVTIRGTVVKVNANILGKNWVHIQDGTGSGETSDLVILTSDESSPGEVVTVKGTVRVDQDPGHGSKWPAFVDGGKLSVEKK